MADVFLMFLIDFDTRNPNLPVASLATLGGKSYGENYGEIMGKSLNSCNFGSNQDIHSLFGLFYSE